MPTSDSEPLSAPAIRYLDQLVATYSAAAGRALELGVSCVGFDERSSTNCVVYPIPGRHLVTSSPERAGELADALGDEPRSLAELLGELSGLGGKALHEGVNHVLPGSAALPASRSDVAMRWLDSTSPDDLAMLDAFYDRCSEDDLDEVEIDRARPDPSICVALDHDGSVLAYASGRAFWAAADADDIGVLVRPDARRRGLGAAVVAEFARRRVDTAPQLYRHDLVNVGSAGVARAAGFEEIHRVIFVDFGG